MSKLRSMIDAIEKDVCHQFEKDGHVETTWLAHAGTKVVIIGQPPDSLSKRRVAEEIRRIFAELNTERACHVFEGWMVKTKDPDLECAPSKHPDRIEVITINGEDKVTHETIIRWREIIRPTNEKSYLGPPDEVCNGAGSGLFQGMLEPDCKTVH